LVEAEAEDWREPIEPFLLRIPPDEAEQTGPSSKVGEVGRLKLSNLTRSCSKFDEFDGFDGSSKRRPLRRRSGSRKTVVLETNDVFLAGLFSQTPLLASVLLEVTSARFLFGEKVSDDRLPVEAVEVAPPAFELLNGVETPEDPLKTTSLRLQLKKNKKIIQYNLYNNLAKHLCTVCACSISP
jgi:hypothetical protein